MIDDYTDYWKHAEQSAKDYLELCDGKISQAENRVNYQRYIQKMNCYHNVLQTLKQFDRELEEKIENFYFYYNTGDDDKIIEDIRGVK